ncbi:hypothetical protein TNIN_225001, partial [Trichonephila inaurata madagascariensis]
RYSAGPAASASAAFFKDQVRDVKVFDVTGIDLACPLFFQNGDKISTGNLNRSLVTLTDYNLDTALDQISNMELEPQSPYSTSSTETAPLPYEELTSMKMCIRKLQIICSEKGKTVAPLRLDHGQNEADSLYQLAWNEFQDIQSTLQQAVSDFDSPLYQPRLLTSSLD